MDFEQFIDRLVITQSKWEEEELCDVQCSDPRTLCFISHMKQNRSYVPSIEVIVSMLESSPEWIVPLVELDLQEKSIELCNTANKLAHSRGRKRMVGLALLELFDGQRRDNVERTMSIRDLVNSDDHTLHYLALCRLCDAVNVQDLLEFEQFIESCLSSGNEDIFKIALQVLKKTENDENKDIIKEYEDSGPKIAPKQNVAITRISQKPFDGDWVKVAELVSTNEPSDDGKNEKKSIFAGAGLFLNEAEKNQ